MGKPICLLTGGTTQEIQAGTKRFFFEMHPYCGPVVVHRGTFSEVAQPPERSPFWRAAQLWVAQGRVVRDGLCVYQHPRPAKYRRLNRNHYEVIDPGQNDDLSEVRRVTEETDDAK